jgi:hypothetical protein
MTSHGWLQVIGTMVMSSRAFSNSLMLGLCSMLCLAALAAHKQLANELLKEKLASLSAAGQTTTGELANV